MGHDDSGVTYFDRASIAKVGDALRVTAISIYRPDGVRRDGVYRADVTHEIDCEKGLGRIVAVQLLDSTGSLKGRPRYPKEWQSIPQGSAVFGLRRDVCSPGQGDKKRPVTNLREDADIVLSYVSPRGPTEIRFLDSRAEAADYFDALSIRREATVARVRVITVFNPRGRGYESEESVTLDVDCQANRAAIVTMVTYDTRGATTSEGVYVEPEWFDAGPDSRAGAVKAAVCSPGAVEMRRLVPDYRADAAEAFGRKK